MLLALKEQVKEESVFNVTPEVTKRKSGIESALKKIEIRINRLSHSEKEITVELRRHATRSEAIFISHLGLGDNIQCSPIARYLELMHERLFVVCKSKNARSVRDLYLDQPSIKIVEIPDNGYNMPDFGLGGETFQRLFQGRRVYGLGFHGRQRKSYNFFYPPFSFYQEAGLQAAALFSFFYTPATESAKTLFSLVAGADYCLMQSSTSSGERFTIDQAEQALGKSKEEVMYLDISKNHYPAGHPNHTVAGLFVMRESLIDYYEALTNARYLVMTDSCLFNLAFGSRLMANRFICFSRNQEYEYLSKLRLKHLSRITPQCRIESIRQ